MRPHLLWLFLVEDETVNFRTAIFRQINKDQLRMHHDALESQPKTPAEEPVQRRVTYVG